MVLFHKIFTAGALFTFLICAPAWASAKTDFQALSRPVNEQTLNTFSQEAEFYYLTETVSGKPYTVEFRKKTIVPAFISLEGAERFSKAVNAAGPQPTSVTINNLAEFRLFLKDRRQEGLSVRIFPSASQTQYTEVRPMTWGVGSSYLFGTLLVLFLVWAITRGAKHNK